MSYERTHVELREYTPRVLLAVSYSTCLQRTLLPSVRVVDDKWCIRSVGTAYIIYFNITYTQHTCLPITAFPWEFSDQMGHNHLSLPSFHISSFVTHTTCLSQTSYQQSISPPSQFVFISNHI